MRLQLDAIAQNHTRTHTAERPDLNPGPDLGLVRDDRACINEGRQGGTVVRHEASFMGNGNRQGGKSNGLSSVYRFDTAVQERRR
jgi:hypothetical protein